MGQVQRRCLREGSGLVQARTLPDQARPAFALDEARASSPEAGHHLGRQRPDPRYAVPPDHRPRQPPDSLRGARLAQRRSGRHRRGPDERGLPDRGGDQGDSLGPVGSDRPRLPGPDPDQELKVSPSGTTVPAGTVAPGLTVALHPIEHPSAMRAPLPTSAPRPIAHRGPTSTSSPMCTSPEMAESSMRDLFPTEEPPIMTVPSVSSGPSPTFTPRHSRARGPICTSSPRVDPSKTTAP